MSVARFWTLIMKAYNFYVLSRLSKKIYTSPMVKSFLSSLNSKVTALLG
jgi:hypothetical protein